MRTLPDFNAHAGHAKLTDPLQESDLVAPEPFLIRFLDSVAAVRGVSRGELRVLDIGCGRGTLVAWLYRHGWDAWGTDIDPAYVANGVGYFEREGLDDRLRVNTAGRWPYPDGSFDVVLSRQVVEHVADLDAFVAEQARVSRTQAWGLHVFPPRFRPVEGHMKTPLAHWLPKGPARRRALHVALALGAAEPYFTDYPTAERAEIFARFSDSDTYYRSHAELRRVFGQVGIDVDSSQATRSKLAGRLPAAVQPAVPALGFLYRHLQTIYLETRRGDGARWAVSGRLNP